MSSEESWPAKEPLVLSPNPPAVSAELREARLEVVRLQFMVGQLAAASLESAARLAAGKSREAVLQQQVRDLRGSLSWRLTRPVRMVRRVVALSVRERGED